MEITGLGLPTIPSCLPVKFLTSPELNFITRMRKTDTDHLHAQQVPSFGTIAGDTAADLSRSEFI